MFLNANQIKNGFLTFLSALTFPLIVYPIISPFLKSKPTFPEIRKQSRGTPVKRLGLKFDDSAERKRKRN